MKIGFSTWGMPQLPIDTALAHLKRIGFDGVEIAVIPGYTTELDTLDGAERARIRRLVDEHGLDLPAVAGHRGLLSRDPETHAENWRRLTGAADLCVDWASDSGPAVLDTVLGSGPGDWEQHRDFVLERLAVFVEYCAARGVIIGFEPHVGDGMTEPDKVLDLLQAIDSPYLKLNFDISHFEVLGLSTAETVAALAPHAAHTHVKDQRGLAPEFEFLIPGEGPFDFAAYMRQMHKTGYPGYITAEVSVQVQCRPHYDPVAAAELSYRTLVRGFQDAGVPRDQGRI